MLIISLYITDVRVKNCMDTLRQKAKIVKIYDLLVIFPLLNKKRGGLFIRLSDITWVV